MSTRDFNKKWADLKHAAFVRDQHRCQNCLRKFDDIPIDPDHVVPRGAGGSNRLSNIRTLCRHCHNAKHGEGVAPTVEIASSGEMTDEEFIWFKQFLTQMVPAMAQSYDVRLKPLFGLDDTDRWYLPLGDLRLLDQQLLNGECAEYASFQPEQYM